MGGHDFIFLIESEGNPLDLHNSMNPLNIVREPSPVKSVRTYLKHHFNNKVTSIQGNLNYALKLTGGLDEVEVANEKDRQRIAAIQTGLREALEPVVQIVDELKSIHQTVDEVLGRIETSNAIKCTKNGRQTREVLESND